ncbi:UDP-sugar transporter-like protein [Aphelenchoides fujianensis]|nr:UDP-sugar transporter-like protein [Aphelenchoides fujianensis]
MLAEYLRSPIFRSMAIFGLIATGNLLFTRILTTKFFFDYPIVILMIQMALTLFTIETARLFNVIKLPAYTFQRGRDLLTPSLFFSISSYLSLNCLDGSTMPIFPFVQRFAPLAIIAFLSYWHKKQRFQRNGVLIIGTICLGSAFSSIYEWSIDLWSWNYAFLALVLHALTLIHIERLQEQYSSTIELIYLNSFNCLCLFLVADLIQDEIRDSFMYIVTSTTWLFASCFFTLIVLGSLFHAALFYCIAQAGAVHTSIMNILAGGIQLFIAYGLSIYLFYDLYPTWTNIIGVTMTVATALYYYFKHKPIDFKNSQFSGKFLIARA